MRCRGFTLLELMIAISIFAVITTFAYSGLNVVLDAKQQTDEHLERLSKIQLGMHLMQMDIEQAVNRPVRDEYGDAVPALRSGGQSTILLELTRTGYANPMKLARSQLQRVGYLLEEDTLYRVTWPVLDRAQDTEPRRQRLFAGVDSLSFHFIDQALKRQTSWPPLTTEEGADPGLPKGIELVVETEKMGKLRRVFRAPESIAKEAAAP
jgi:general secretion pathway protein J